MTAFIQSLDSVVLETLYAHRDLHVVIALIGLSELGSTLVVCGLAGCVALILALKRRFADIAGLAVSVGGSGIAALILKELVHRARPGALYQAYTETGYSFPSGHATLAVAFYGYLVYLVWHMTPSKWWRRAAAAIAIILIGTIGFSRLYLGVHYLSDVVAGYLIGTLFVLIGTGVAKKILARQG